MPVQETSIVANDGGTSQSVAISSASAASAAINAAWCVVTLTTAAFMRQGAAPVAVADGTDQYLMADVAYRIELAKGNKLAFKTSSASGTAYITPGA